MKYSITNIYTERGELSRATGRVRRPYEAVISMHMQETFTIMETPCFISHVDSHGNIEFRPARYFKG